MKEAGAEPGQQSVACSSEAVDSVWPPLLIKQLKQGLVKGVSVVRILGSVGEKVCSDVEVARDPHCLKGKPMGELCVKGLQREVLQGWVGGPTRDILAPCFATHSEGGDNATEDEDASQVVKDNTVGPSSQEVAHEEDEIDHPKEFTQSGTCPAQGKGKGCGILNAVARVVAHFPHGHAKGRLLEQGADEARGWASVPFSGQKGPYSSVTSVTEDGRVHCFIEWARPNRQPIYGAEVLLPPADLIAGCAGERDQGGPAPPAFALGHAALTRAGVNHRGEGSRANARGYSSG